MRILFVTPYVPSRIRVRSFNLIKALSKEHEIHLVCLLVDDYEKTLVHTIEKYCRSIHIVTLSRQQAFSNCLRALPTPIPLRVAYYHSEQFIEALCEVVEHYAIDVIHGELIKVVPALQILQAKTRLPVLYDCVDCISWLLQQKLNATHNRFKRFLTNSELRRMQDFERTELSSFECLIISSPSDRDRLGILSGQSRKIKVVRNYVDTDYFSPLIREREKNVLVFCAKMDYFPNSQAILHFCKYMLPLIWQQQPDTQLIVVGNNPPATVRALEADSRITITGFVPDIRPYLGTATVALAPLLVAVGTQYKILEALAMGTPIVTTPRCSKALGTQHGKHLLVAEGPQAYADAILMLLNNSHLAEQLGTQGRNFVQENYSWDSVIDPLTRLYQTLLESTARPEIQTPIPYTPSEQKRKV